MARFWSNLDHFLVKNQYFMIKILFFSRKMIIFKSLLQIVISIDSFQSLSIIICFIIHDIWSFRCNYGHSRGKYGPKILVKKINNFFTVLHMAKCSRQIFLYIKMQLLTRGILILCIFGDFVYFFNDFLIFFTLFIGWCFW